jgi:RNA polymerase sigma factor (sigma-70 family)
VPADHAVSPPGVSLEERQKTGHRPVEGVRGVDQEPTRWREVAGRRPAMGDHALVAALRCEDEGALREFFLRFRPGLLAVARRLHVSPGEVDTLVDDCLADVAVHLITSDAIPPRSLPAYLARSLRNRMLNDARSRARADRRLAREADLAVEDARVALHVPATPGPGEAPALSPALQRLAAALEAPLGEEDRLLAVWMSHCVPRHEIAGWLGLTPKTAAKRIERLRERLQVLALRYVERADGDERRELLAFLGRATLAPRPAARLGVLRGAAEESVP